jgi:nitrogen regulatory protein PII-like uncharacterized protein
MQVTVRGKKYEITKEKVIEAVRDITPQRVVTYSVSINEQVFPIKQVLSVTLGIPPMEFGTMTAYQILQDLGFTINRREG